MKKLLFIVMGLLTINANAADIYVNSSGQAGSYPTLAGALAAANNGDRILVSNIITLTETDTINKSVTIISTSPGDQFELIGDLYVEAVAGLEIRIIGLSLNGSITALVGTATEINRCQLFIVESEIVNGDINCDVAGLGLNLLYSRISENDVILRFGKLIANEIQGFHITPGDSVNYNDTIFIIANVINSNPKWNIPTYYVPQSSWSLTLTNTTACNLIDNNDHFFFLANNYFKKPRTSSSRTSQLIIRKNNISANGGNIIQNNTIIGFYTGNYGTCNNCYGGKQNFSGQAITFHYSKSHEKTKILNNVFTCDQTGKFLLFGSGNGIAPNGPSLFPSSFHPELIQYNIFGVIYDGTIPPLASSYVTDVIVIDQTNYYNNSNNGFTSNISYNSTTGKVTSGVAINGGKNLIDYYDIDMTRNDLGTYGGPYSWDNYWNTASGSARIYNLDLPFEIWSGQPNVKADAVHQK